MSRIVARNYATGRAQRVLSRHARQAQPDPLTYYIDRVIMHYAQSGAFVSRVYAGDAETWRALRGHVQRFATRYLWRAGGTTSWAHQEADEYAQQVCCVLALKPYPCDVPFDAWVRRILRNYIKNRRRSHDVLDHLPKLVSLDTLHIQQERETDRSTHEHISSVLTTRAFDQIENQDALLRAISQLRNDEQRKVIAATYLEGLQDDELAQLLGRTRPAVHLLRHRALHRLREILQQSA